MSTTSEQRQEALHLLQNPKVLADPELRAKLMRIAGVLDSTAPVQAAPPVRRMDPEFDGLPEPRYPLGSMYRVWGS